MLTQQFLRRLITAGVAAEKYKDILDVIETQGETPERLQRLKTLALAIELQGPTPPEEKRAVG